MPCRGYPTPGTFEFKAGLMEERKECCNPLFFVGARSDQPGWNMHNTPLFRSGSWLSAEEIWFIVKSLLAGDSHVFSGEGIPAGVEICVCVFVFVLGSTHRGDFCGEINSG